jgi:hypothetical protein
MGPNLDVILIEWSSSKVVFDITLSYIQDYYHDFWFFEKVEIFEYIFVQKHWME